MAKRTIHKRRNSLRVKRSKNKKSYYTRKRDVKRKLSHYRKFSKSKRGYKYQLKKTKRYKRIKGGSFRKVGGNIESFKIKMFALFQKVDILLKELKKNNKLKEYDNLDNLRMALRNRFYFLREEDLNETDIDIDKYYIALETEYDNYQTLLNNYRTLLNKYKFMEDYLKGKTGRVSLICDLPGKIKSVPITGEDREKYFQTIRKNDKNYVKNIIVSNKITNYELELEPIIKEKLKLIEYSFRFTKLFDIINNYAKTERNNSLKLNKNTNANIFDTPIQCIQSIQCVGKTEVDPMFGAHNQSELQELR